MKLPSRKWWFILLGGFVLLLLIALVALPLLIDVDRYRGLIQTQAEEALGREVGLGELSLSLIPFGVRVDSLSIAALPEEGGGNFLTAKSVQVGARLIPLLSKRLEVTSIEIVSPEVTLVRGIDGNWNVQRLVASTEAAGDPAEEDSSKTGAPAFRVDSLHLTDGRIHLRDLRPGLDAPLEMTLEQIDLHLRDVAWDEHLFPYDLSAVLGSGSGTEITMTGRIGPLVETPQRPFKFEIKQFALREIDPAWLASWFEGTALPQGLQIEQPFSIGGTIEFTLYPGSGLRIRTNMKLAEAVVGFTGLDGTRKSAPFEFGLRAEIRLDQDGSGVQLPDVKLMLSDQVLVLSGSLARQDLLHRIDLEIQPGQVRTDDLTKLAALVGVDLPVGFSSEIPIEFQAGLHGYVGPDQTPELDAKLTLTDLTLRHPSMDQPVEQVGATVSLIGDHLEVSELQGVVGSSDIAGSVTLDGFGSPHVVFDLHSRNADFGELFSFLDREPEQPVAARATADDQVSPADDPLAKMTLEGRIRIDRGTFRTLDFSALDARMTYADEVLILDPLTMQLYDGTFRGRIESDLGKEPPPFAVRGDAREIDVNAFIVDNLEAGGLLAGRFSGSLETRGSGTDFESIVRHLEGAGSIKIDQGQLGRLNVMERLSSVSGLFGASTLQSLTGQLGTEGTEFEILSGEMQLSGGRMRLENLIFDAPAFDLRGEGVVDLLASALDGRFRLSFSPEISAAMRSDHSQAARVFWNSSTRRIELPLTLSGPFHAPMPGIDFEEVAENLVKQELRDYIGQRLGLTDDEPQEAPRPAGQPTDEASAAPRENLPDRTHADLSIEFARPQWRGSFLSKDLQVSGTVRGKKIDRAELLVVDSEGREFRRVKRQEDIEAFLSAAADRSAAATIGWRVLLDGKRLLRVEYPLTVTFTLYNTAGESARSSLQVDR